MTALQGVGQGEVTHTLKYPKRAGIYAQLSIDTLVIDLCLLGGSMTEIFLGFVHPTLSEVTEMLASTSVLWTFWG